MGWTPPSVAMCYTGDVELHLRKACMEDVMNRPCYLESNSVWSCGNSSFGGSCLQVALGPGLDDLLLRPADRQ